MPATATFPPVTFPGQPGWNKLKLGPWGFNLGVKFSADGLAAVTNVDVDGAYYSESPNWTQRQILTRTGLPSALYAEDTRATNGNYASADGCADIAIAPSDKTRLYFCYAGYILKSTDKGVTATLTNLTRQIMECNGREYRRYGPKLEVDNLNPNVVYFAGQETGLNRSMNGLDFTEVQTVRPTVNGGDQHSLVIIDRSSATIGSGATLRRSRVWHIITTTTGLASLYESTNGGDSFTLKSASLPRIRRLAVDSAGVLYMTTETGRLLRWESGALSADIYPTGGDVDAYAVAIDPSNNSRIVVLEGGNAGAITLDRGATWTARRNSYPNQNNPNSFVMTSALFPYMSDIDTFGVTSCTFRPGATNDLWVTTGVGMARCAYPDGAITTGNRPVFNYDVSDGIESLVTRDAYSPTGSPPILVCHDRPFFRSINPDAYPAKYGPDSKIRQGNAVDGAKDNPAWLFGYCVSGISGVQSATSTDAGRNWSPLSNQPANQEGGCCAVGNAGNVVLFPGGNKRPKYTLDGAATAWADCTFTGFVQPADGTENGWGFGNISIDRFIITHDGTYFYAYNYGCPTVAGSAGVWRSTNGATWTQIVASSVIPFATYHSRLESPRGQPGVLFLSSGDVGGSNPANTGFAWSNNAQAGSGVTFNTVTGLKEVKHFGFGKAAAGQSFPTIYLIGYYNDVFSAWRCQNFNPATGAGTWTDIGLPNTVQFFTFIRGNYNIAGQVLAGGKAGAWYGNFT